jgi:hypothetical protein
MNYPKPLTGSYPPLQKGGRGDSHGVGAVHTRWNPPQSPFAKGGRTPHDLLAFPA